MLAERLDELYDQSAAMSEELERDFADKQNTRISEFKAFIDKVRGWALRCIDLGRFLPSDAAERRALQGQVDVWASLLRRHEPQSAETRLKAFDPDASEPLEGECPYPGLRAYGIDNIDAEQHARDLAFFLGRDAEIEACLAKLSDRTWLSIVANSGAGKSSLAMAGVLPRLEAAMLKGWVFAPRITPGAEPMLALERALTGSLTATDDASFDARLAALASPGGGRQAVENMLNGARLVIFIDQLEELLSLCRNIDDRRRFSATLRALAGTGEAADWPVRIITTMRTDHLGYLEREEPELYLLMKRGEFRPEPLDAARLADIVAQPAAAVGLRFVPPTLIDELAGAAAGMSAGLPLLQFALYRLWTQREKVDGKPRDMITREDIERLPTVQSALGTTANELYQSLVEQDRRICHRLMMELAEIADNYVDPLRRRRDEVEVRDAIIESLKVDNVAVERIIKHFVDARLLVRSGDGERPQLEVAHEALFTHWAIFRDEWLLNAKAQLVDIRVAEREARAWQQARAEGKKATHLLKQEGPSLAAAKALASERWLSNDAREYVAACDEKASADARQKQAAREERARRVKAERAAKTQQIYFAVVGVVALVVAGFAWLAYSNWQQKEVTLSALLNVATQLDSYQSVESIALARYLSNKQSDERFQRTLALARDRVSDAELLPVPHAQIHLMKAGRGVVIEDRNEHAGKAPSEGLTKASNENQPAKLRPGEIQIQLVGPDVSANSDFSQLVFAPPSADYTVALTSTGYAIDVSGPRVQGRVDRLLWVAWRPAARPAAAEPLRLAAAVAGETADASVQGIIIKAYHLTGTDKITAQPAGTVSLGRANDVESFVVADDLPQKIIVATVMRPNPDAPPEQGELHWLTSSGGRILKAQPDTHCRAPTRLLEEDGTQNGDDIVAAAWLDADSMDAGCPVTARKNGTVVCPSGDRLPAGQQNSTAPVKGIYPAGRDGLFVTFDYDQQLRLWQCPLKPVENKQLIKSAEDRKIARGPFGLGTGHYSSVAFGYTRIFAVSDNNMHCWDNVERNQWPVEQQCLQAINATQVGVEPSRSELLYIENSKMPMIRHRKLGFGDREAVPVVSPYRMVTQANVTARFVPTAETAIFERFDTVSQQWRPVSRPKKATNIMNTSLSGDGRWLAYAAVLTDSEDGRPRMSVYAQAPDAREPGPELGAPRDVAFGSITRVAVTSGADNKPTVFLAANDALYVNHGGPGGWRRLPITAVDPSAGRAKETIQCLAASPKGEWLVLGTKSGQVLEWHTKNPGSNQLSQTFRSGNPVSACAIADNGSAVIGDTAGRVYLLKPLRAEAQNAAQMQVTHDEMTRRKLMYLPNEISAVSIDAQGRHVGALAKRQNLGCEDMALPGQTVRIWKTEDPHDDHIPLASRCFVDSDITSIDALKGTTMTYFTGDGKLNQYQCNLCEDAMDDKKTEHATEENPAVWQIDAKQALELYGFH